ncbi:MAG: hypothetical protein UT61_C0053G0017 [Candidatus Woesebacteria bacterium GW2011_GWA1_39_8]|uniref:Uncharacterized protein n=1 Tax=Candidatus Woesebacteria bacterium GW2011_GWA1_39_8 TaxID=1618552 RepID=A0A0G0PT74_9BACT|nr:MAG: hypothetical protein UT61_C0053G0017 [Candidatus Woesebacteria bacterium GW2011_GWA1_39_8]
MAEIHQGGKNLGTNVSGETFYIIPTPNKEGQFVRLPKDALRESGLKNLRDHTEQLQQSEAKSELVQNSIT